MRRSTRLKNSSSNKMENMGKTAAQHFAEYNFSEVHRSLRVTPATEARFTNHVRTRNELIGALSEAPDTTVLGSPKHRAAAYP